ncbi:MAG: hypothetical protein HC822_17760 [Oscillochloris sp.]|nr:hypothetical protein [Oscillochloris sp.]
MTDYTEQDTERARAAERNSAGMETQHLSLPSGAASGYGAPVLPQISGQPNRLGMALIAIGALMLLGRMFSLQLEIEGGLILMTIASVFYFFGLWKRIYGLIIPAGILAGLSLGVTFADLTDGVSVLWGLALGFLSVYGLGVTLFNKRHSWPVIPAAILFAVGMIVFIANFASVLGAGLIWMPLLLIGAGLYLGFIRKPA